MTSPQIPNDIPSGSFLRSRREAAGLSLREVATALEISHGHLGRIETGERIPSPDLVERMDKHLADRARLGAA